VFTSLPKTARYTLVMIVVAITSIAYIYHHSQMSLQAQFLSSAVYISKAIDLNKLRRLSGSEHDVDLPEYRYIKEQLRQVRLSNEQCKFLYILGLKPEGEVFFFVDSQRLGSADYVPPGFVYEDVAPEMVAVMHQQKAQVVGPFTDQWGTLVTAVVPIRDASGHVVATLGMDSEVERWYLIIAKASVLPILLVLVILWALYERRIVMQQNLELQEAQLKIEAKNTQLKKLSSTDLLTDVWNRRYLNDALRAQIVLAEEHGEIFTLALIDIDYFKHVNDRFGHLVGDQLLKEFAHLLAKKLPPEHVLGRWGGEEFIVLCCNQSRQAAFVTIEQLREQVAAHHFLDVGRLTISVGLTQYRVGDEQDSVIERADQALYLAKKSGRNQTVIH